MKNKLVITFLISVLATFILIDNVKAVNLYEGEAIGVNFYKDNANTNIVAISGDRHVNFGRDTGNYTIDGTEFVGYLIDPNASIVKDSFKIRRIYPTSAYSEAVNRESAGMLRILRLGYSKYNNTYTYAEGKQLNGSELRVATSIALITYNGAVSGFDLANPDNKVTDGQKILSNALLKTGQIWKDEYNGKNGGQTPLQNTNESDGKILECAKALFMEGMKAKDKYKQDSNKDLVTSTTTISNSDNSSEDAITTFKFNNYKNKMLKINLTHGTNANFNFDETLYYSTDQKNWKVLPAGTDIAGLVNGNGTVYIKFSVTKTESNECESVDYAINYSETYTSNSNSTDGSSSSKDDSQYGFVIGWSGEEYFSYNNDAKREIGTARAAILVPLSEVSIGSANNGTQDGSASGANSGNSQMVSGKIGCKKEVCETTIVAPTCKKPDGSTSTDENASSNSANGANTNATNDITALASNCSDGKKDYYSMTTVRKENTKKGYSYNYTIEFTDFEASDVVPGTLSIVNDSKYTAAADYEEYHNRAVNTSKNIGHLYHNHDTNENHNTNSKVSSWKDYQNSALGNNNYEYSIGKPTINSNGRYQIKITINVKNAPKDTPTYDYSTSDNKNNNVYFVPVKFAVQYKNAKSCNESSISANGACSKSNTYYSLAWIQKSNATKGKTGSYSFDINDLPDNVKNVMVINQNKYGTDTTDYSARKTFETSFNGQKPIGEIGGSNDWEANATAADTLNYSIGNDNYRIWMEKPVRSTNGKYRVTVKYVITSDVTKDAYSFQNGRKKSSIYFIPIKFNLVYDTTDGVCDGVVSAPTETKASNSCTTEYYTVPYVIKSNAKSGYTAPDHIITIDNLPTDASNVTLASHSKFNSRSDYENRYNYDFDGKPLTIINGDGEWEAKSVSSVDDFINKSLSGNDFDYNIKGLANVNSKWQLTYNFTINKDFTNSNKSTGTANGKSVYFTPFKFAVSYNTAGACVNGSSTDGSNIGRVSAPDNIKKCIINNTDEAGNTYKYSCNGGFANDSNPYCNVFCKEDYAEIKMNNFIDEVKCGKYFKLTASIKGSKDCYTGANTNAKGKDKETIDDETSINIKQFEADVKKTQEKLLSAMNDYRMYSSMQKAIDNNAQTSTSSSHSCGESSCGSRTTISISWEGYKKYVLNWSEIPGVLSETTAAGGSRSWSDRCKCDDSTDAEGNTIKVCGSCDNSADTGFKNWKASVAKGLKDSKKSIDKYSKQLEKHFTDINDCTTGWSNEFIFNHEIEWEYTEGRYESGSVSMKDIYSGLINGNDKTMVLQDTEKPKEGTCTTEYYTVPYVIKSNAIAGYTYPTHVISIDNLPSDVDVSSLRLKSIKPFENSTDFENRLKYGITGKPVSMLNGNREWEASTVSTVDDFMAKSLNGNEYSVVEHKLEKVNGQYQLSYSVKINSNISESHASATANGSTVYYTPIKFVITYKTNSGSCNTSTTGQVLACDGEIDEKYEYCSTGWKYINEMYRNFNFIQCDLDRNICEQNLSQNISYAKYVKKSKYGEASYVSPSVYYQTYPNAKIVTKDEVKKYTGNELQFKLVDGLPVTNALVNGGTFKIIIKKLGEFYDKCTLGRIIGDEPTSINKKKGTWDGVYECGYNSSCRHCPDCHMTGDEANDEVNVLHCPGCRLFGNGISRIKYNTISLDEIKKQANPKNGETSREFGWNWNVNTTTSELKLINDKAKTTLNEIEKNSTKAYDEKNLDFSIKLDSGDIKAIKEYNSKNNSTKNTKGSGGYLNDSLSCYDYIDKDGKKYENVLCYSDFLDLFSDKITAENRNKCLEGSTAKDKLKEKDKVSKCLSKLINEARDKDSKNDSYWQTWDAKITESVYGGPSWK